MADNYRQFSETIVGLNKKEVAWCAKELEKRETKPDDAGDEWESLGFDWSFDIDGKKKFLWVRADEYGNVEQVVAFAQAFLKKFRPYGHFSMTWSDTCSRLRTGEFSGGGVFVTAATQQWFSPESQIQEAIDQFEEQI